MPKDDIIRNIRANLASQELTQYALAKKMTGNFLTNHTWLSRFMNGKIEHPELESLYRVANAFGIPIEALVGESHIPNL